MKAQIARLQEQSPDSAERMEMVRVQIFLDRANFRPGKIDGLGGEFTQKAADRYCRTNGLPEGSRLDVSSISAPYRDYTITKEDLDWIGPQASEPPEQETLKAMLYADLWELVAAIPLRLDFARLNRKAPNGELTEAQSCASRMSLNLKSPKSRRETQGGRRKRKKAPENSRMIPR
jgi:hypothetical protein